MSLLTDLPHEIYFLVANSLQLGDLATLLFSCKQVREQIGNDVPLQKVFLDNTPMTLPAHRCIHRKFVQNKVTSAVNNNWPEGVIIGFKDLRHESILMELQFNIDHVSRLMNKGILNKIYTRDADKVLGFIIDNFIESAAADPNCDFKKRMLYLMALVASRFLVDVRKLGTANYPTKSAQRMLDLLNKYRDHFMQHLLAKKLPGFHVEFDKDLAPLEALHKLNAAYPQHAFDFKSPLDSSIDEKFVPGHQISILEFAVLSGDLATFQFLVEQMDLTPDPEGPYMALAYFTNDRKFRDYVHANNLGRHSENLPEYLCKSSTSILEKFITQQSLKEYDYCEIERMLISNKFPLTPAEEERFSTLPETRIERKVLKCLQTENYSPFENVEMDFEQELTERERIGFENFFEPVDGIDGSLPGLKLSQNKFEYVRNPRLGEVFFGTVSVSGSNLICTSEKKRFYTEYSNHVDYEYYNEADNTETFKFIVFRMFDDTLAVCLEEGEAIAPIQRWCKIMRCSFMNLFAL